MNAPQMRRMIKELLDQEKCESEELPLARTRTRAKGFPGAEAWQGAAGVLSST